MRNLREVNGIVKDILYFKLKFGERAFAVAAPKAWNSLPDYLITKLVMLLNSEKTLKTHLFNLAGTIN